ncbi:MAG: hypothetical protein NT077_03255 [Candidatus Taylorbacteria bacterium]|nr:hypothetical protein [Candidatus Taylorbacteria bacterium]
MKRVITIIFRWALIADMFILSAVFLKLFANPFANPFSTPVVSASELQTIGPAAKDLMIKMEMVGLSPRDIGQITRPSFTANGRMITLKKDNMQIFEYADPDTATNEASALTLKYKNSSRSPLWKKQMHVRANGTLVMFYMGDQSSIVDFIAQN